MKKIIAILMAVVMMFTVAGCGGSADPLVGTWVLDTSAMTEGMTEEEAALVMAFMGSMEITYTFNADGTLKADVSMMGEEESSTGTYKAEGGNIVITGEDGTETTIPYTLEGNKLVMETEGQSLTFTRK